MGSVRAHLHKVSSLMKSKSKRQSKFKETLVGKKWNRSGATLDERWRRRRTNDKKEMDDDRRSGVATRKVEVTARIWVSFFFSLVYTLPADIRYFSRNSRYVLVWPGIWSGMKQPCFCSGLSTGTANSGRTDRYGTESTFLISTNIWSVESGYSGYPFINLFCFFFFIWGKPYQSVMQNWRK